MPVITSAQNPAIKRIRSLAEKKYRQETGLFVAEGEKVLARAHAMGWQPDTVLACGTASPWGEKGFLEVTPEVMAAVSAQNNPPPLLAAFRQAWGTSLKQEGLWLALEDMRDPGNLGSIIRTADAAGVAGLVLIGQSCDPWGRDCVRATMGSIFAIPLFHMGLADFGKIARGWPGEVAGTHVEGAEDFRRPYGSPTLIVMGSEGRGLSPEAAGLCSTLVRIPMREGPQSLNVAAATALMLFEVQRPKA